MITRSDIVLLDANVIIEAHRTKCWNALARGYRLETVEQCCIEVATEIAGVEIMWRWTSNNSGK
jgi:hypothetical protein